MELGANKQLNNDIFASKTSYAIGQRFSMIFPYLLDYRSIRVQ